ncbi:MAG: hypothetical protein ACLUQ6_13010 [Alistipes onderdonkii]
MRTIVTFFSVLLLACGAASCQKADSEEALGQCGDLYAAGRFTSLMPCPTAGRRSSPTRITASTRRREGAHFPGHLPRRAGRVAGLYGQRLRGQHSPGRDCVAAGPGIHAAFLGELPRRETRCDFFLTVDIAYLKANADKDFSLPVTISDPTRYALNDKLTTTQVRIDTSELLSKEGL